MLAIVGCLFALQVQIDQPSRLRTILPNGAAILVEKFPGAKSLSVQLFVSSRGTEETPISNGLRHLLEHLIARGPKGDIDKRLETAGGFLEAETSRDGMIFKLSLPPGKLDLGIRTIEELMQMPVVSTESIQHESLILEQEAALRDGSTKFSIAAWAKAFGDKGLDPEGNLDVVRNATPAMLDKLHRIQFSGSNLAISVVGDVDLDSVTKACAQTLSKAPKAESPLFDRGANSGGRTTVDAHGVAFAIPVPGWRLPATAARLAAALALASEADHCFMIYTPSAKPGMVILGRQENTLILVRAIADAKPNDLFARGQTMAKLWIARMLQSPEAIANIRGLLIMNAVDLKPETLLENLNAMTHKQFAAIEEFRSADAIVVEGR